MKQQINFRASDLTARQLEALMQFWGTSQTETLTVIIDRMYKQEIPTVSETPKYFVPGNSTAALMLNRSGDIGVIVGDYGDTYSVEFPDSQDPEQWSYADGYTANTRKEAQVIADNYLHYQSEE